MHNPLLLPQHPLPFDQIEAVHVEPALVALVEQAQGRIAAISADTAPATWENTLQLLEDATLPLEVTGGIVEHLESIATTPALRAAYNATLPLVTAFWTSIALDAGLYARIRELSSSPDCSKLDPVRLRLLTKTVDEFRRHGAELDEPGKAKLRAFDEELSRLTAQFSQNVLDATNAFEYVTSEVGALSGLPESALTEARQSAMSKGQSGYRFTLHAPSLLAVLTYADDADLRERLWVANDMRCRQGPFDNSRLVVKILELRRQKAALLGYRDFADFVMVDRMAKTGENAARFIAELTEQSEPSFERERDELRAFRQELEGPDAPALRPWDVAYYAEKLRKRRFDFDEEELRAYFPAERMLEALFVVSSELFGIRIVPEPSLPVWDPSVRAYAIHDEQGEVLGILYVDLYPRENKNGGAWMHGLVSGCPNVAVIAANASPPAGDRPSLLTHRDVETLWHEFGHLLHHCLSRVPVRSLSGTRVAHDFVELPSQIMENWCWERKMLDRFARHWQTGATIPERLVERLRAARTFRAATGQMRQLGFSSLDLALHREYDSTRDGDVLAYARRIQERYSPVSLPEPYGVVATFTHLFARPVGYASGYYSYKWAEVLDADAFGRFAEQGVMNPEVGRAWRRTVLEQGDAREPMDLFVEFRGRPPRPEALLTRLGLSTATVPPTAVTR